MGKKVTKLLALVAILVGVCYLAIFGIGKDGYGSGKEVKLGLDLNGGLSITFQAKDEDVTAQEMEDAQEKLEQRVLKYSTEASVYLEGDNRINVEIPLKNADMASAKKILDELGQPGTLEFVDANKNVIITGADVKDAQAMYFKDETTGATNYVVELKLYEEGGKKFAEGTKKVSQMTNAADRTIAVIYDGEIISNPRCEKEIAGGEVIIEGMESYEAADKLATYLRIGAIPVELETIRSNIVAPQLGSNAIKTSLNAAAIGVILIILFMCIVYRMPGVASSIALIIYIGLVAFTVSAFEITLTLPGIAGIILSIGMAVDANVIIFARIREELGEGNSVSEAIANGFNKAFSAIFDGNITTLIAAGVLYLLGSGTIKGFASTLAIGIILSMFTALVITKFILKLFYELGCTNVKLYGVQKKKKTINFLGKKNIFFAVSLVLILMGPVVMFANNAADKGAFNFGIEFAGGSSTKVTFNEKMSQDDIETNVVPLIKDIIGTGEIQVQRVEGSNEVVFKSKEITADQGKQISDKLVEKYSVDASKITSESISSTISSEMRNDAILAIAVATVAMLVYIWFRFSNIRYAASAIFAILHDVLIVVAFYALTRITVGNTFIACMLTIVGYTINATIVIFDRIRENIAAKGPKKYDLADVINQSITETLTRSVNTSFTTFITLFMLYVLGVSSIKEFSFPLMVGVVIGGYSSVCITGSLLYMFIKKFPQKVEE